MTTRERLAKMLAEAGYPLKHLPVSATGYYRINKHLDDTTVCWDGFSKEGVTSLHVVSYDTMTACVRNGFSVAPDPSGYLLWVYANPAKPKA